MSKTYLLTDEGMENVAHPQYFLVEEKNVHRETKRTFTRLNSLNPDDIYKDEEGNFDIFEEPKHMPLHKNFKKVDIKEGGKKEGKSLLKIENAKQSHREKEELLVREPVNFTPS